MPAAARDGACAGHAARRPRPHDGDRLLRHVAAGHDAPVRLHDEQLAAEARVAQAVREPRQVAFDLRPDVRVHQRRAGALELRRRRHHLVRQRHHDARQLLRRQLADAQLVDRVDEREQQHDGERLDALLPHATERATHGLLVERHDDVALEVEALGNAVALAARADRWRRRQRGIPDVLLEAAPDLDLVAVAVAGDEPGDRPRHLDHRVVGGRRAVDDQVGAGEQLGHAERLARREALEAAEDAVGLVARRGRMLVEHQRAVGARQHQVGEGAADVDADPVVLPRHAAWLHRVATGAQAFDAPRRRPIAPAPRPAHPPVPIPTQEVPRC